MAIEDKVVITAALTGVAANRNQCQWIPYTPQEIAEDALACYNAGASVGHIHARENDGSPSWRVEVFREIMEEVRKRCPIIINFSTGAVLVERDARIAHIKELKPEIAALNMGTMMRTLGPAAGTPFSNIRPDIEAFVTRMKKFGVKPEMEVYSLSMFREVNNLIQKNLVEKPAFLCTFPIL